MQSFNPTQIEQDIIKQKTKLRKLSHNYKINFENIEKKILIDVEEIEKLKDENKPEILLPMDTLLNSFKKMKLND